MKENKEYQLKVRLTLAERDLVKEYAAAHNMTISELVRMALDRVMGEAK